MIKYCPFDERFRCGIWIDNEVMVALSPVDFVADVKARNLPIAKLF